MWPDKNEKLKPIKRAVSEVKPKKRKVEEEKKLDYDSDIIEAHEVEPQARSISKIIANKQVKNIDQRFIYEEDSEPDVEQPSVILQKQIDKLIEEEAKLKAVEEQIAKELKDLRREVTTDDIDYIRDNAEERADHKRKSKKGRKKKSTKTHHDMRRMKQDKLKKILNKDQQIPEESPKTKIVIKDFQSDHDSIPRAKTSPTEVKVKYKDENVQINIEKLESSGVKDLKIERENILMKSEVNNLFEMLLARVNNNI